MAIIKGKPGIRRVPSDDCPVRYNQDVYYPHIGETVWLVPAMTVGEYGAVTRLGDLGDRIDAIKGDPDDAAQIRRLIGARYEELCTLLAKRVVKWNWTALYPDTEGNPVPLPQPDGTAEPLRNLSSSELYWLLNAAEGETAEEEKKDSSLSTNTSSATTRPTSPTNRSSARNRTRVS